MVLIVTADNYVIVVLCLMVKLTKKESNSTYHVDVESSTCTCKYFHYKGYCKHLVFSFQRLNHDSNTVAIWCTFKYKGNTKCTKNVWKKERCRSCIASDVNFYIYFM